MNIKIIIFSFLLVAMVGCSINDGSKVFIVKQKYISVWNFTEGGYTLNILTSGNYYNFTNFILDGNNGFTFNKTNNIIKPLFDGTYKIYFSTSIECGINGRYGIGLSKNNIISENTECYTHYDGEGRHDIVSFSCILNLTTNDYVIMQIDDENSPAQNCNVVQENLNIISIN